MIKRKNYFRWLSYLAVFAAIINFAGCSDDPSSPDGLVNYNLSNGALTLCEGGYGTNTASISFKGFDKDEIYQNMYENTNGSSLGDLANCMTVYNDNIYIAVQNSNKIEVVGLRTIKKQQTIDLGAGAAPRSLIVYGSSLYVTSYRGYVYKINLSDGKITDSTLVGSKPEAIAEASGKLFVVNSGWDTDSTVSVIDGASGDNIKTIPVGFNPQYVIKGDDGFIYAVGGASYSRPAAQSGLWKINPQTLAVEDVIELSGYPGKVCNYKNNTLLILNNEGVYVINPAAKSAALAIPASQVNSSTGAVYSLGYDAERDEIYCGNPKDYKQNGEIAVFKEESGSFVKKSSFDCGILPNSVIFIR